MSPFVNIHNLWSQTLLTAECHVKVYQESICQGILAGIQFTKRLSNSSAAICTCSYVGFVSCIRLCVWSVFAQPKVKSALKEGSYLTWFIFMKSYQASCVVLSCCQHAACQLWLSVCFRIISTAATSVLTKASCKSTMHACEDQKQLWESPCTWWHAHCVFGCYLAGQLPTLRIC